MTKKEFEEMIKVNLVKQFANELIKDIKKQPEGLLGVGGMICPSNPKYFKLGYIKALKDLKLQVKMKQMKIVLEESK